MFANFTIRDNENAIKAADCCFFIADLLIKQVQLQLKRKWASSNLTAIIRLHLMNYLNLFNFLNAPEQLSVKYNTNNQLKLRGSENRCKI